VKYRNLLIRQAVMAVTLCGVGRIQRQLRESWVDSTADFFAFQLGICEVEFFPLVFQGLAAL
jgi:hypothetical protein